MVRVCFWLLHFAVHTGVCWAISQAACLRLKHKSPEHLLKVAGSNVAPFILFGTAKIQRVEYIRKGFPVNNRGHSETCWSIPATPLPHSVCRVVIAGTELWIPDESNGQITIVGNTAFGGCVDYPSMIDGASRGHVVVGLSASHFDPIPFIQPDWKRQPPCWFMLLALLFSAYVLWLKAWSLLCESTIRQQWAHHHARYDLDQKKIEKLRKVERVAHGS